MTVICLSSRHCTKPSHGRDVQTAMPAEPSTVARGQQAEDRALAYLQLQGLVLLEAMAQGTPVACTCRATTSRISSFPAA